MFDLRSMNGDKVVRVYVAGFVLLAVCALGSAGVGRAAVDRVDRANQVIQAPQFARFCTAYENATPSQVARSLAKMPHRGVKLSDAAVLSAVETYLAGANASPRLTLPLQSGAVSRRNYEGFGQPAQDSKAAEAVLLHVTSGGSVVWLIARFDPSAKLVSVRNAPAKDVAGIVGFGRFGAAYMLLNDLLASDAVVPVRGCALAVKEQLAGMPEVRAETAQAFLTTPAQDAASVGLVATAYAAFVKTTASSSKFASDVTRATLKKIGANPGISFMYRDPGTALNGGKEIAVVRIGSGAARTYAIVSLSDGRAEIDSWPLCIEGDESCAKYYEWP